MLKTSSVALWPQVLHYRQTFVMRVVVLAAAYALLRFRCLTFTALLHMHEGIDSRPHGDDARFLLVASLLCIVLNALGRSVLKLCLDWADGSPVSVRRAAFVGRRQYAILHRFQWVSCSPVWTYKTIRVPKTIDRSHLKRFGRYAALRSCLLQVEQRRICLLLGSAHFSASRASTIAFTTAPLRLRKVVSRTIHTFSEPSSTSRVGQDLSNDANLDVGLRHQRLRLDDLKPQTSPTSPRRQLPTTQAMVQASTRGIMRLRRTHEGELTQRPPPYR